MSKIGALLLFTFLSIAPRYLAQNEGKHSVFWQIISPNKADTSYLFGTIHLMDHDKYVLPAAVVASMINSEIAYFEVVEDLDPKEAMSLSQSKKRRLSSYLEGKEIDSLFQFAEQVLDIDSIFFAMYLESMKPFAFSQLPLAKHVQRTQSYDQNLIQLAKEKKIQLEGLETFPSQLKIFDKMPEKLSREMILETIRNSDNALEEFEQMQDNYLRQNLGSFLTEFENKTPLNDYLEKELLDKRNRRWIQTLTPVLRNNSIFIAVGAAHLAGPKGLVNQFQQLGFGVREISVSFTK